MLKAYALAVLALELVCAQEKLQFFKQYMNDEKEDIIVYKNFTTGISEVSENQDFSGNPVPVIGIIAQSLESEMVNDKRFYGFKSYIMKSYVDWLEAQGARVVPIIPEES